MLRAELKRILKTRSTWCLAAIALLICLSSALSTVRQVVKYIDHDGHTEIVRGISVYEENRQRYSVIRGEVTPELFASAVALHHELLELYGTDYDIPPEISGRVLGPYSPVYTWIFNAFFRRIRRGPDLCGHLFRAGSELLPGAAVYPGADPEGEIRTDASGGRIRHVLAQHGER